LASIGVDDVSLPETTVSAAGKICTVPITGKLPSGAHANTVACAVKKSVRF
jgi:hypothetical protein